MKRRLFFAAAISVAALLAFGAPMSALAQGQGRQGGRGPGQGRRGGFPFRMSGMVDPARSNASYLVQRDDVQRHLVLTVRQKDALNAAQQKQSAEMVERMRTTIQGQDFSDFRDMPPEERRERMREFGGKLREQLLVNMEDSDKRLAAILKPAQMKRLMELDLQWRGPLALSDPKVAPKVDIAPEQAEQIGAHLQEYRAVQQQAVENLLGFGRANRNGADAPPQPENAAPPNPQDIETRIMAAQREVEKVKKSGGEKVVALLDGTQRQKWQQLLGKPFLFRKDLPTQ